MQITKSTEHKVEKSLVPMKEQVKEFPQKVKKFFTKNQKRTAIVTASVLVICAAVAVNWLLFGSNATENPTNPEGNKPETNISGENPDAEGNDALSVESFFALAVTDRQKAREEAMEVLQTVVESSASGEEEKAEAADAISKIANYIEAESKIETLVKSKGFSECVAVVSEDQVSVIVGTEDTLMPNELAQIKEIIYLQTKMDPSGMRITEKIMKPKEAPTA